MSESSSPPLLPAAKEDNALAGGGAGYHRAMRRFLLVAVGLVAVGAQLFRVTSGGRLIFVAPVDSELGIIIDSRPPLVLPPGGFTDAFVSWGSHTVVTETSTGKRTNTFRANLSDALLVPANEHQCFVVIDVSDAYTNDPTRKLLTDWRPAVESLGSNVTVAPNHIWVTRAPTKISRTPGEPARILYPHHYDDPASYALNEWMGVTFGNAGPPQPRRRPAGELAAPSAATAAPTASVSVELKTDPPGAEVVTDGSIEPQLTPVTLTLAPGTKVLLRKEGFVPVSRTSRRRRPARPWRSMGGASASPRCG